MVSPQQLDGGEDWNRIGTWNSSEVKFPVILSGTLTIKLFRAHVDWTVPLATGWTNDSVVEQQVEVHLGYLKLVINKTTRMLEYRWDSSLDMKSYGVASVDGKDSVGSRDINLVVEEFCVGFALFS